ncbi:MAG: hypothetical protein FMNOHCHN_03765 [Ignavibacteriaceae bacterium]|nr:hypothetical protein [Ignavibacteriaceae bacterium]
MSNARKFKPAVEGTGIRFIKPGDLAEAKTTGVILEGTYMGAIPNNYDNTKNDYKFLDDNGQEVVINSTGSLAYQMKNVPVGSIVQITYEGMSKLTKGKMKGKEAHNFKVLVAEE